MSLIARIAQGDKEALAELFREYGPGLLGYTRRFVGNEDDAQEIVQDTVIAAWEGAARFEGRSSLKTWLFRIAHNKAVNVLKKRSRYVQAPDDDPEMHSFQAGGHWAVEFVDWQDAMARQTDAKGLLEIVREKLDDLPHAHREVLLLREVQGLSNEEICEVLGISETNCRVTLHRARKKLRKDVDDALAAPK